MGYIGLPAGKFYKTNFCVEVNVDFYCSALSNTLKHLQSLDLQLNFSAFLYQHTVAIENLACHTYASKKNWGKGVVFLF